ncbi:myb-like protein AA [Harpegnathos saltator]|uniref:myb-like protein AA n=1 Tax=Harpegnathos saltator TaxID=610380 RepID=UPI000DBEF294|nr:myb-like protein AA [Harpegnathos saltator]
MSTRHRESPKQRHARQSSVLPKRDRLHEGTAIEVESALQRYENAVLKYQKPKLRPPKRQISRERQQQQQQQQRQQQSNNYSSSDESVARNKSKSTSSIDTQSVNNILDEYEDLDYRRSSDLSDVGSINVTNFEAVMMDQQKRQQQQQQGKPKLPSAKPVPTKSIPTRERVQPVLKVNQQTQVRQRSRDRQKEPGGKGYQRVAPETETRHAPVATTTDVVESGRTKMPEILLRKGEVQKRVDEWLNQAHSQNFPVAREKPLTRSNSSAEQKSQRRYRQDSRSRSIDEARERLNGASSSYDDLSRMDRKAADKGRLDKVNVGVNTSRAVYKEYLAVKNKARHDYGFAASNASSSRSGDSSPASRIPQRGVLGSSFRSRRVDAAADERLDERNSRPAAGGRLQGVRGACRSDNDNNDDDDDDDDDDRVCYSLQEAIVQTARERRAERAGGAFAR